MYFHAVERRNWETGNSTTNLQFKVVTNEMWQLNIRNIVWMYMNLYLCVA